MNVLKIQEQIKAFFLEDIGEGDVTNQLLFQGAGRTEGELLAKQSGILSGVKCIEVGYQLLDPSIHVTLHKHDGDTLEKGERIATIEGPVEHLLTGERVILNLLQHMSGIATITKKVVNELNNSDIRVCDTRKTFPGLRMFEKYAVTCGGGFNHRKGLYDGIMLKDNHIAFAGSISNAVQMLREQTGHMVKIEVETENQDEVIEAVQAGADIIMFDNCTPEEADRYAKLVPQSIITEISGGITLDNIASYRDTDVDYISLGFITQSAPALDISFNLKESRKYTK
ncbi:carboxylating nicotinate-nucleotide diphosphorylase [Bacillus solimangrovi]|uniref:Probable nicotinate-nucleotide pyrophosphorylase [carboxylating] n=1 Tax=Bacillus solimangrovi TaxID=1305675 RepID=A0A1E5LK66_9BACI|nr:carboxylating nicotinate-nucleotide diphosphorylase [Bacillus solimangrovi]OEH94461.1 nicotinate-nucleotide diphosphorylase (carboxylating) [Bacillus solimangrovi]